MSKKKTRKFGCVKCGYTFDENHVDKTFLEKFGFPSCPNCKSEESSDVFETWDASETE